MVVPGLWQDIVGWGSTRDDWGRGRGGNVTGVSSGALKLDVVAPITVVLETV